VDADVTVSVVGTGRMGAAMVARLRAQRVTVTVFNRTAERAAAVADRTGADLAPTARAAAAGADVVLVSLADDAAVEATYAGADGLVAGLRPGTVVADTSTIDPRTAIRVGDLVRGVGAAHLDAPVSGSVPSVESGQLTVLAGGALADLDRARPVLAHLSHRIVHVGPAGTGATIKLAVNGIVHALNQALSEALVLAEAARVDRSTAYDVFAASVAGAPFVQYKRAAFEDPDGEPPAFTLDLVGKDLDLLLALAGRAGVPMAQATANRAAVDGAVTAGFGDRDMSAIAEHLRRRRESVRQPPGNGGRKGL
jgi:3-hydroxyisobutyrate dehydrogenase-like beta-hydroxyacid dehydrogenase